MGSLQTFLFIVQIILSVLIILFVLLQQTDEDSLSGIGGGANAKMLSKRNLSTPVSKTTMILFILFMLNSLLLATISARNFNVNKSTMESYIENKEKTESKNNNINSDINTTIDSEDIEK